MIFSISFFFFRCIYSAGSPPRRYQRTNPDVSTDDDAHDSFGKCTCVVWRAIGFSNSNHSWCQPESETRVMVTPSSDSSDFESCHADTMFFLTLSVFDIVHDSTTVDFVVHAFSRCLTFFDFTRLFRKQCKLFICFLFGFEFFLYKFMERKPRCTRDR